MSRPSIVWTRRLGPVQESIRQSLSRSNRSSVAGVRLYGIAVSDINCRLLVAALITDGTPAGVELAERMSGSLARHEPVTALSVADRDTILRNFPKPLPSGLVAFQDALAKDKRARA